MPAKKSNQNTTNSERCRKYRDKIAQDPTRREHVREMNKQRAQKNRLKPKTEEELEHLRKLARERQRVYDGKKRQEKLEAALAAAANGQTISRPKTRMDREKEEKKKEAHRQASQKHRDQMSAQKRRRVNEKRMALYYKQKEERLAAKSKLTEKAVQAEQAFLDSGCPYPTEESFRKAVQRVRAKFKAQGSKLAHLFKGVIKSSDQKTKEVLKELNVSYTTPEKNPAVDALKTHINSLKSKRDKTTVRHKRCLANAFEDCAEIEIKKSRLILDRSPYKRAQPNTKQTTIADFFENNSVADPCKSSKKRQLTKSVKELHREFQQQTKTYVSLRTFHRMKPKNVASVKRIKFRQCLCEICLNPQLKVTRLNVFLKNKTSVKDLLNESVCNFSVFPALLCIDRKCCGCGVSHVSERIKLELGENLKKSVGWSRWELVKKGTSNRMEKVKKNGSISECLSELIQELGPLFRHTFNAEWQRKQLQSLKAALPEGWVIVTCDYAENFLCRNQDEPQSAHWAYSQVTVFPVVVHYKCPEPGCKELKRESLVFFSDDLRHDAHVTQVCLQRVLQHIASISCFNLKKVIVVSDGCAAQFKSKLPFLFLTHLQIPGVTLERVFFGARHGKNDSDWCGGAVKRAVTQDIASGRVTVSSARDMYEHCFSTLQVSGDTGKCQHKLRQFFLIAQEDVKRLASSSMVATVPGSRKLHHLKVLAPGVLATRQLSCFCTSCVSGQSHLCFSSEYADEWETVKLKYSGPTECLPSADGFQLHDRDASASESDSDPDEESHALLNLDSEKESPIVSSSESESDSEPDVEKKLIQNGPVAFEDSLSSAAQDRRSFFSAASAKLAACRSFQDVQAISVSFFQEMGAHALPKPNFGSQAGCHIDSHALALLPPNLQQNCLPLSVSADGNCFFRTLSLLMFGREDEHEEMRVRVVVAMATNQDLFLDGKNWTSDFDVISPDEIIKVAVLTSAEPQSPAPFQQEVLAVCKPGSFAGIWEVFAASHILKHPIRSVFPSMGWGLYRLHCNRIIKAPCCLTSDKPQLMIMWTSLRNDTTSEHWVPNHFVPIVLRSRAVVPQRGSFHIVHWNKKDYVGQVKETDQMLEMVCVSFMTQKPNTTMYHWPSHIDISWEPLSSIKQEVFLTLVEDASTQRCQIYRVV